MSQSLVEKAVRYRAKNIVRNITNLHFRRHNGERPICDNHPERKAQYHHANYNEPLQVMRLCGRCHYAWHRKNQVVEITIEKAFELIDEYGWGVSLPLGLEEVLGEKKAFYRALNTLIGHESRDDHFFRLLRMRNVELTKDVVRAFG